jgi:hypothetical protein
MSNNMLDVDLDSEISIDEVLKVLTKAKNGKAPGIDHCQHQSYRCSTKTPEGPYFGYSKVHLDYSTNIAFLSVDSFYQKFYACLQICDASFSFLVSK